MQQKLQKESPKSPDRGGESDLTLKNHGRARFSPECQTALVFEFFYCNLREIKERTTEIIVFPKED